MARRIIAEFTTPQGIAGSVRTWEAGDRDAFIEMHLDPEVMEFLLKPKDEDELHAAFERISSTTASRGWGLWAVEADGQFAGWAGLNEVKFEAKFAPSIEIGWRFRRQFWGKSIAYSAAKGVLDYAFTELKLPELVSFTTVKNVRSRRLMERLGFERDLEGDFDFPSLSPDHPLLKHVLYRKTLS